MGLSNCYWFPRISCCPLSGFSKKKMMPFYSSVKAIYHEMLKQLQTMLPFQMLAGFSMHYKHYEDFFEWVPNMQIPFFWKFSGLRGCCFGIANMILVSFISSFCWSMCISRLRHFAFLIELDLEALGLDLFQVKRMRETLYSSLLHQVVEYLVATSI